MNGVQCLALVGAIIIAGEAVLPNVLYGCRGLWSVLLAPLLTVSIATAGENDGHRFRLAGAGLIAGAIACTFF